MKRGVLLDYFFTLADPTLSSEETFRRLYNEVLPGVAREAIERRKSEWLRASGRDIALTVADYRSFTTYVEHWTRYGEHFLGMLGVKDGGFRFAQARLDAHRGAALYADAAPAVQRLREQGLRVVILSDADHAYFDDSLSRSAIDVDAVVLSEDVACHKPNPAAFAAACAAVGVDAREVVHVGDGAINDVEGARAAGMEAVWVNRSGAHWPLGTPPPTSIRSLSELPALLDAM